MPRVYSGCNIIQIMQIHSLRGFVQIHRGFDHLLQAVSLYSSKTFSFPWVIATDGGMMQEMRMPLSLSPTLDHVVLNMDIGPF